MKDKWKIIARRALEDPEVESLIKRSLSAYENMLEATYMAQRPEAFLSHHFAWENWERDVREGMERLGTTFFAACVGVCLAERHQSGRPVMIPPHALHPTPEHYDDPMVRGPSTRPLAPSQGPSHIEPAAPRAAHRGTSRPRIVDSNDNFPAVSSVKVARPHTAELLPVTPDMIRANSPSTGRRAEISAQRRVPVVDNGWAPVPSQVRINAPSGRDLMRELQQKLVVDEEPSTAPTGIDLDEMLRELRVSCRHLRDMLDGPQDTGELASVKWVLKEAVQDDLIRACEHLSENVLTGYLSFITAVARWYQEITEDIHDEDIRRVLALLEQHARHTRRGFVRGVSRHHTPRLGSWIDDARHQHERVSMALKRHIEQLRAAKAHDQRSSYDDDLDALTEGLLDVLE